MTAPAADRPRLLERLRRAAPLPLRAMGVVGGAVFAISTLAFFRVPLLPDMGAELGLSPSVLGLVATVFAIGRLVTDIPAGRLADRVGVLALLAGSSLLMTAGGALLASAPTATVVLIAAFVLGVGSSVTNTSGMTYFSAGAPAERRGTALAVFSAALLGGQALGPTSAGLLALLGTWRTSLAIGAGIGVIVALGLLAAQARGAAGPRGDAVPGHGHAAPVEVPAAERLVLYAVPFAGFFTLGAMPQTLVPLLGAEFGLTVTVIGLALGAGGLCRFAGALVGGWVSDHVGRKAALVPGLALQAAGVALLAVENSVAAWLAAIALLSLASYGISVAAAMLADHARGSGVGRRLGSFRFVGDLGLIAGPALAALLYDTSGVAAAVLLNAALLAATALASALVLTETRLRHPPSEGV